MYLEDKAHIIAMIFSIKTSEKINFADSFDRGDYIFNITM
jgi:hypothetical protein